MISDPLHSSKYSVTHARRHISALRTEIHAYFNSIPFTNVVEFDPVGGDDIHKVRLVKGMPEPLSGITFDAISSLRAALDQAGRAIGVAAGGNGKKSHFPFGDTLEEVKDRGNGRSRDIPKPLFDLMVASGPYKSGNHLLWALNKLCNSHKHEIIIPMAIYTGSGHIRNAVFSSVKSFAFPPRWDHAKKEMVVAVVPHGAALEYDMKIGMSVAIAKVEGVAGRPAIDVLVELAKVVDGIISSLETEAFTLGIFK